MFCTKNTVLILLQEPKLHSVSTTMESGRRRRANGVSRCFCFETWMALVVAVAVALCLVSSCPTVLASPGFSNDPYKVLGVSRRASSDEIKKCYRKLCLLYHPDKNVQKPAVERTISEAKFKKIREAYDAIILGVNTMPGAPMGGTFFRPIHNMWFVLRRPDLFLSEMRRLNLFATGTPYATRGPRNPSEPNVKSVYVETVKVPLEQLYKGVPLFRLSLEDNLLKRYWASIRGNFIFYSLYQASTFVIPLARTSRILAGIIGIYIVHGTTPIPDPKATYFTTIRRGTKGGEKTVRFDHWRQLEVVFKIQEAEHRIFRRIGNNLHAQLTLTRREAKRGCRKRLVALDPTEETIEITIPAKKYSYKKEQKFLQRQQQQQQEKESRRKRKRRSNKEDKSTKKSSSSRAYNNTIRIQGRGWPIRKRTKSYGDLIVTIRVEEKTPSKKKQSRDSKKRHLGILSFLSRI